MAISLEEQERLLVRSRMWCELRCEVCAHERALGVASTIIPYSAAFGRRCLQENAQPEWVVSYLLEENGGVQHCNKWFLDVCKVYLRGVYITVREYDKHRKLRGL